MKQSEERSFQSCWEQLRGSEGNAAEGAFRRFLSDLSVFWDRLAARVLAHLEGPRAVELEDVRQRLIYGAWVGFHEYDPDRVGKTGSKYPLAKYVCFRAVRHATKFLHQQRRDGAGNVPRHELLVDDLFSDARDDAPIIERLLTQEPRQEQVLQALEWEGVWGVKLSDLLDAGLKPTTFIVLRAYFRAQGEVARAAEELCRDAGDKLLCRVDTEEAASSLISRTIRSIRELEERSDRLEEELDSLLSEGEHELLDLARIPMEVSR